MLDSLDAVGLLGFLIVLSGIGVLVYVNPLIAAGIALVVFGVGLVAYSLVSNILGRFGLDVF